jgi:hypothetical protein
MAKHKVLLAVAATYLVMSFVPQIGLMQLMASHGSGKAAI